MGKKTKIHPLPLTVIRGAAEYCGFKFGAIKQTSLFDDNTQARYIADVEIIPRKLQNKTDAEILAYLADCFAISVIPVWPRRNKAGLLKVDLRVDSKNRSKPSISNGGGGGGGWSTNTVYHGFNDDDDREIERPYCDECGTTLVSSKNCSARSCRIKYDHCDNQSCGASPHVGEDWL